MSKGITGRPLQPRALPTRIAIKRQLVLVLLLTNLGSEFTPTAYADDSTTAVLQLDAFLAEKTLDDEQLVALKVEPFASTPLSASDTERALRSLWSARVGFLKTDRKAELDAREIVIGELKMPFWFKVFGDAPADGRSLFISMHGGGGAPARVNDQQYENQTKLYQPEEGIYLVPRAPTNTWNLWHEAHIDAFFDRLITDMIVLENVNPNRVYLMGYSAGGDGVYQLAPRMADRIAAAAMMAGHPNEARPDGLRNIGFTLHMGANDSAYNRNQTAEQWGATMAELKKSDPDGYVHSVTLHQGKGHWMNLEDAVAIPWMAKFTRNAWPSHVVWLQDDVLHKRFYWLQVNGDSATAGDKTVASMQDGTITIHETAASELQLLLTDRLTSLDKPITVTLPNGTSTTHSVTRTIATLSQSLLERNDPESMYSAVIDVAVNSASVRQR